jgi:hypothetical protein
VEHPANPILSVFLIFPNMHDHLFADQYQKTYLQSGGDKFSDRKAPPDQFQAAA